LKFIGLHFASAIPIILIFTHTLLENHTPDVHDYKKRGQLIDKTYRLSFNI